MITFIWSRKKLTAMVAKVDSLYLVPSIISFSLKQSLKIKPSSIWKKFNIFMSISKKTQRV